MADRTETAARALVPADADSHGGARKPRGTSAVPSAAADSQKGLAVPPAVPLHVRPVLNGYAEVAAVGILPERTLRRLVAIGRVKRSVIRNGRNLRFVKDVLIAELLEPGG